MIPAPPHANLTIAPSQFMEDVGCMPVTGRADSGAVAIPAATGPAAVFNCRGVSHDSIVTALARYHDAVAAASGGEHMTAGYYDYEWVGSTEWCWTSGYDDDDGYFHKFTDAGYWGCFWVDNYIPVWEPGSGGGGDGGGSGDDGGGGGGNGQAPPLDPTPVPPALTSVTIAGRSTTANVGDEFGAFTATGYYVDGSSRPLPTDSVAWTSDNTAVASPDGDYGYFDAIAEGTATVSGAYHNLSGSATVTVGSPTCGDNNDPNAGLIADDELPTAACSPSQATIDEFGSACLSTTDYQLCLKIMVGAKGDGELACAVYSQSPECAAWLNKLMSGDTSAVQLTVSEWNSILADTAGKTIQSTVFNVTDPDNGVVYPMARVWLWDGNGDNSFRFSLGRATIYYDEEDNPVALHDDYNFHPGADDKPGVKTYLKTWINDATNGKSFRVHYP